MHIPFRKRTRSNATAVSLGVAIVGAVVFYFTDNPFSVVFRVSLIAVAGGILALSFSASAVLLRSKRPPVKVVGWVWTLPCLLLTLVLLIAVTDYRLLLYHRLSEKEWQEDIAYLAQSIRKYHPNPSLSAGLPEFESQFRQLQETRQPDDAGIQVGLVKLVATLHDGHSSLIPFQPATGFHMLPLQIFAFSDGIYVTDAAPAYRDLVGKRLAAIEGVPIMHAYELLEPLVGADNEWTVKDRIPLYLLCPEVLQVMRVIPDSTKVQFAFTDDTSRTTSAVLRPVSPITYFYWYLSPLAEYKYQKTDAVSTPLHMTRRWDNYWFHYDPTTNVLLFEFNQVRDQHGETFQQFSRRLLDFARSHAVSRLIIDLRNNTGGDNTLVRDFVEHLRDSELNQRGRLYTLIGRHTFSAAVNLTTLLENRTRTLFVGEPTGAGPNHYGDAREFHLPHSRDFATISSVRHIFGDPLDRRSEHDPDIAVPLSHNEYFSQRDPVLEAALNFHPVSVAEVSGIDQRRFLGRYSFDGETALHIVKEGNTLSMDIPGFQTRDLYPISDVRLLSDRSGLELEFVRGRTPLDDQLIYHVHGGTRRLQRLPEGYETPLELLLEDKLADAASAYHQLHRETPGHFSLSESRLNRLGYEFLQAGRVERAKTVFALNVEFYPQSANTYDSLGEVLLAAGDRQGAILNYRRSLQLDPNNSNARRILKKLGTE